MNATNLQTETSVRSPKGQIMKLYQYAVSALIVAMPMFAVERAASVAEGTVRKIDSSAKTILVATKDGAEHTFHFGERTAVHGVEAIGRGSRDALNGLKAGTDVAVHYTTKGTVDTAEEIDHLGADGLKATEGTVKKIDRGAKTITIATADGTEQTFRMADRATRDTGRDIEKGADKSAKVTVYYSDEGGGKIAHFFKSAF
jgi:Cu/Ag efflux protein CusF